MQRKRLEDMNLLDDFLFNAVMTFPGIGERFCRLLLQVVLGREIGILAASVSAFKTLYMVFLLAQIINLY